MSGKIEISRELAQCWLSYMRASDSPQLAIWANLLGSAIAAPVVERQPVVLPDDPRQLLESAFKLPDDIHWVGDKYLPIGEQPYSFESLDRSCEWDSRLEGVIACLDKVKELNQ